MNNIEWLTENMGSEYTESFEGQVFLALEKAYLTGKSNTAFQGLRQVLAKELVENKQINVNQSLKSKISAQMIYAKAFELNKCWLENPEQFIEAISNAYKIFKGKYSK